MTRHKLKKLFKYAYELIIYIELCECLAWFRRLKPNCAYFTYFKITSSSEIL